MKIKYNKDLLTTMNVFTTVTRVTPKDAFLLDDVMYFVVNKGLLGKAIGKGASNMKRISQILGKKLRIVEFFPDAVEFLRHLILPLKVEKIQKNEQNELIVESSSREVKAQIIGRNAKNLNMLNHLVKRYFPIKEIKIQTNSKE